MFPFCRTSPAITKPTMGWRVPRWPLISRSGRARRYFVARSLGCAALTTGVSLFAPAAFALDVNSASAEQLEGLRGLGPRTAQTIVRERERGGKFESLEDLSDRVRGIGSKKAQALQAAGMTVGGASRANGTPGDTAAKPGTTLPSPAAPKAKAKPTPSGSNASSAPRSTSAAATSGRGLAPGSGAP